MKKCVYFQTLYNKLLTFLKYNRPLNLIFAYIALIFIFAGIYCIFFSDKFYNNAIRYEAEYKVIKDNATKMLKEAILFQFKTQYLSTDIKFTNDIILPITTIIIDDLRYEDNDITFKGYFQQTFNHGDKNEFLSPIEHEEQSYGFNIANYYFTIKKIDKGALIDLYRELIVFTEKTNLSRGKHTLIKTPEKDTLFPKYILMTDALLNQIRVIGEYNNGILKHNNFWRMFYFSAVTITTIGYGDIIPLSDSLRIIISIEAILGIVFIGLFINALGNRMKMKN